LHSFWSIRSDTEFDLINRRNKLIALIFVIKFVSHVCKGNQFSSRAHEFEHNIFDKFLKFKINDKNEGQN
jgi:hypothetical protein